MYKEKLFDIFVQNPITNEWSFYRAKSFSQKNHLLLLPGDPNRTINLEDSDQILVNLRYSPGTLSGLITQVGRDGGIHEPNELADLITSPCYTKRRVFEEDLE